jgi:endonuclease/exonuclease/phosphatase family metal-dependent hydrolase
MHSRFARGLSIIPLYLLSLCCLEVAPIRAAEPLRLRVMSYNIHHGEGVDGKVDLPRLAGVIRAEAPDIVALQEVDQKTDRTGSETLGIFEKTWMRSDPRELMTYPVDKPSRQIDFILVRPKQRWKALVTRVLDEAVASVHRAIIANLELNLDDNATSREEPK